MMRGSREWLLFLLAGAVTLFCWKAFGPDGGREKAPAEDLPVVATKPVWSQGEIDSRLVAVTNASTDAKRLAASTELLRIPLDVVPDQLERMKSGIEKDFPPEARILLIRWASADGEAAVNWAWKSFRSGYRWKSVFNEVGATWAAHDPAGFMKWAVEAAERSSDPWGGGIPLKEAESSEHPLMDYDLMKKVPEWLITESPYLAHKFILETGAKVYPRELPGVLDSVQDVRESLAACEDADGVEGPTDGRGGAGMRNTLLLRWFELDPENFNRSPHAKNFTIISWQAAEMICREWTIWPEAERVTRVNGVLAKVDSASRGDYINRIASDWVKTDPDATARWLDALPPEDADAANKTRIHSLAVHDLTATLDWTESLPLAQRRSFLTNAFDTWTQAHPGQRADREGWPAARVRAWEDLEALLPAGGR